MKLVITFYKHAFPKICGNLQRKVSSISLIFHFLLGNSIKIEGKVNSLKTFIFCESRAKCDIVRLLEPFYIYFKRKEDLEVTSHVGAFHLSELAGLTGQLASEIHLFQRVFTKKLPPSCILFRIWLIWLDSFHEKWNSNYDGNGLAGQFWQNGKLCAWRWGTRDRWGTHHMLPHLSGVPHLHVNMP